MIMRGVVVLFILTLARVSKGAFYLSIEESNWFNVSSICKLGTPDIVRTVDGHYADVHGIDLRNEKVWTGFYRTMKKLEYIDCVRLDDTLQMIAQLHPAGNEDSLTKCVSECGSPYLVGVTKSKCYCIEERLYNRLERSKITKCTHQCRYHRGVACGFESVNDTYLSVHKLNVNASGSRFEEKVSKGEEKHCLTFNQRTKNFFWEDCNKKYNYLCSSDYSAFRLHDRNSWMEAANSCFSVWLVPTSISNTKLVINNHNTRDFLWTGVVRINSIYKIDNYYKDEETEDKKTFGILTKMPSNNKYLLSFENGRERRRSLCQGQSLNDDKSQATSILTVMCVLIGVLLVTVSLAYLYRRRIRNNALIQANASINTTTIHGNNETILDNNYEGGRERNSDLACQHYYITSTESVHQNDQVHEVVYHGCQSLQEVANGISERYQSLDVIRGGGDEIHDNTSQAMTGTSESLQDRTIETETHNNEAPTNMTYESVEENI